MKYKNMTSANGGNYAGQFPCDGLVQVVARGCWLLRLVVISVYFWRTQVSVPHLVLEALKLATST